MATNTDNWKEFQKKAGQNPDSLFNALTPLSPGLASFYEALGFDGINVLEVDSTPTIGSFLGVEDLDADQKRMVNEASLFATRVNQLVRNYFKRKLGDDGIANEEGRPFYQNQWPQDLNDDATVFASSEENVLDDDNWHSQVGGPLAKSLLEDIKVILESPLVSLDAGYVESFFSSAFNISDFTSGAQFDSLTGALENTLAEIQIYLIGIGGFGFTTKPDIPPGPPDSALPGPIATDGDLEGALEVYSSSESTHYIAFLLDKQKSGDRRDTFYLPVRHAPNEDPNNLTLGWDDESYSPIDQDGQTVTLLERTGIEVPQGLGIFVTEIVESQTGIWVGFVFDELDPKFNEDFLKFTERQGSGLVGPRRRALYTRPEYLRRKVDAPPDPLVKNRLFNSNASSIENAKRIINESLPPGIEKIDPRNNQNWLQLFPEEVVVSYYNFIKNPNQATDYILDLANILNNKALRYSEGYFYFILGQGTAEIIPSAQGAAPGATQTSVQTIEQAKDSAWNNLLNYLNKEKNNINSDLYDTLKRDYFVPVAFRVNTNSSSPNNLKVLFAIRTGYVDALPDSMMPYGDNIDATGPYSDFIPGKNFAFTMYAGNVKKICAKLKEEITNLKNKINSSPNAITVGDGQVLEYDVVMNLLEGSSSGDFPTLLEQFLRRQAFPASTKKDFISDLIKEAADDIGTGNTDSKHIIEVGLKDNNLVGDDVRYTISYILFSPDPDKLFDSTTNNFNLFYYDPYVSNDELGPNFPVRRSATPLNIGLDNIRVNFEGVHGSLALHYLYSYSSIINLFPKVDERKRSSIDILYQYSVPPIKISAEPEADDADEKTEVNCDELFREAENFTNIIGAKERRILAQIKKHCKEKYYKQFEKATPAVDPEMTKKALESKAKGLDNLDAKVKDIRKQIPWPITFLYDNIINTIDIEGIIALILACIQAKLGIPLTAEALCRAAILKLIESMGIDRVEAILLQNAAADPGRYVDLLNSANPIQDSPLDVNGTFSGAPIATYMTLHSQDWDLNYPGQDKPAYLTPDVISIIKQLEKGGVTIDLVPADRPDSVLTNIPGNISFPESNSGIGDKIVNIVYGDDITIEATYTEAEIDKERQRLLGMGYGLAEVNSIMVYNGYLKPVEEQYGPVLNGEAVLDPLIGLADISVQAGGGAGNAFIGDSSIKNLGATAQDAQNYLDYLLSIIDLQSICELLVGSLLEGFEDLLQDPAGFLSGGIGNWFDGFLEKLKRKFSFPEPTFRFPDNLKTDTHMDGYGRKLLEMLLTMVAVILGQILNLVIKDALMKCIEEVDEDNGQFANGGNDELPTVRIPGLDNMLSGNKPKIMGDIPYSIAADLMDDILDELNLGQVCSLLSGDASQTTLSHVLQTVRDKESKYVYDYATQLAEKNNVSFEEAQPIALKTVRSTLGSFSDIEAMFLSINRNLQEQGFNLEICNEQSPTRAVLDDICTAFYDREGRAIQLQEAGLTEEEANNQIDNDLDALKNEVMLFAPMLFPFGDGFGESLNSMPDICDIPGAFQVPPGVENAMNMVTDNILENVKGSLIQDMTALKFFAIPSRAMLAASDGEEMKKAISLLTDTVRKPFQKNCIAFIGNPLFYTAGTFYNPGNEDISPLKHISCYPITYGAFSNKSAGNALFAPRVGFHYDNYVVHQSGPTAFGNAQYEENGELKTVLAGTLHRRYYDPEEYRQIYNYYLQTDYGEIVKEDIFEDEFFKPTSFVRLLSQYATYFKNTKPEYDNQKEQIIREILAELEGFESLANLTLQEIADQMATNPALASAVQNYFEQEFAKDLKPKAAGEMVFEVEHLLDFNISGLYFSGYANSTSNGPPSIFSQYYKNLNVPHPWKYSPGGKKTPGMVLKHYPLTTPLSAINPDIYKWQHMFSNYFGFRYSHDIEDSIMDSLSYNKDGALAAEDLMHPIQLRPRSEWSTSEDIIDESSLSGNQYLLDNVFVPNANPKNQNLRRAMRSPALYKLLPDAFDIKKREEVKELGIYPDEPLLSAFCKLTLGEAIGLEDDRISSLFPNFPTIHAVKGVVLGAIAANSQLALVGETEHGPFGSVKQVDYNLFPLYAVFNQTFMDPKSPLYAEADEMIEFFTAEREPVNPELFKYLSNDDIFPQILGYDDGQAINVEILSNPTTRAADTFRKLNLYENYNPNTLKYDLPFSEAALTRPIGYASTTFNASQKTQDIFNLFSVDGLQGVESVDAVLNRLEIENKENSLVFQHAPDPSKEHAKSQMLKFTDEYRALKGKLTGIEEYNVPPGLLYNKDSVRNELFDLTFKKEVDEDILDLITEIYDGSPTPMLDAKEDYESLIAPFIGFQGASERPAFASNNPFELDAVNFKGMVFGRLLTYKYKQKFDQYSNFSDYSAQEKQQNDQENYDLLQQIFSTHSYSSLHYAYSNQMFAKLKRSRLQERKFMKKLWDKLLVNTLGNKSGIHPECRQLFDHLNMQSSEDLQTIETDLFKIDEVKKEILEFYRKSLCRDVYERNDAAENSVRFGLLQGVTKLLVQVYSLEMCIASIISWDSFDLADVFDTDIMVSIIVNNMENDSTLEDLPDLSIEKIKTLARDIVKKDNRLDDEELGEFLKNKSALAYMISDAGVRISSIVRDLFNNSQPLTTDLTLEVLKNSDTDFVDSYKTKVLNQTTNIPDNKNPEKFKKFYDLGGYEYVVDVRFNQNIYTMNYGSGHMHDLLSPGETSLEQYKLNALPQDLSPYKAANYVNLYGFNKRDDIVSNSKSKNFFHSLPYNYYQPSGYKGYVHGYAGPGGEDNNPWLQGSIGDVNSTSDDLNSGKYDEYGLETDEVKYHRGFYGDLPDDDIFLNTVSDSLWNKQIQAYLVRSISGYEDFEGPEYDVFLKINNLMSEHLGRADAFNKENFKHTQIGNSFNGNFGNVMFEPYVKIEDYSVEDFESDEYAEKFGLTYYIKSDGDPASIDPCENPFQQYTKSINDLEANPAGLMGALNVYRLEENIFNCYMFDYVPLAAWSHFYTELFLKNINLEQNSELKDIYSVYGFAPFFKSIKFGIRMNYSTTLMIAEDDRRSDNFSSRGGAPYNYYALDFRRHIENSFRPGAPNNLPGFDKQVPAWGLKSSKTLYSHRPYYLDVNDPDTSDSAPFEERYRICDELKVPIVEMEREITCVPQNILQLAGFSSSAGPFFIVGSQSDLDEMIQTGNLQQNLISIDELGNHSESTKEALGFLEYTETTRLKEEYDTPAPTAAVEAVAEELEALLDEDVVDTAITAATAALIEQASDPEYAAENLEPNTKLYIEMLKLWAYHVALEVAKFPGNWEKWDRVEGNLYGEYHGFANVNIQLDEYSNKYEALGIPTTTGTTGGADGPSTSYVIPLPESEMSESNLPTGYKPLDLKPVQIYNRINAIFTYIKKYGISNEKLSFNPDTFWMSYHPDWVFIDEDDNPLTGVYEEGRGRVDLGRSWPGPCDETMAKTHFIHKAIIDIPHDTVQQLSPLDNIFNAYEVAPNFDTLSYAITMNNYIKSGDASEPDGTSYQTFVYDVGTLMGTVFGFLTLADPISYLKSSPVPGLLPGATGEELFNFTSAGEFLVNLSGLSSAAALLIPLEEETDSEIVEVVQKLTIPNLDTTQSEQLFELLKSPDVMMHLTKNFHQFFYKNLAQDMMGDIKSSPEFRLMYDHLFPMKTYMALSFVMASDSLSKFIPEPTDVLEITKRILGETFVSLDQSVDYKFLPGVLDDFLRDEIQRSEDDTRGAQPNLSKQILMIILRTSYLILKGFVEITDPAVIIAKAIIDAANAVQKAIVAGIEQGIRIAKQSAQATKDTIQGTMKTIEGNIGGMALPASIVVETSLKPVPIVANPSGKPDDNPNDYLASKISIDTSPEKVSDWEIKADSLGPEAEQFLDQDQIDLYNDTRETLLEIKDLQEEYAEAEAKFLEIEAEIQGIIKDLETELAKAKKEMKKFFQSPFLLPGLWTAMLPSMMPLGGGIIPPPFPGGPPSTVPGMIYIALLFIDAYEESQHNISQQLNEDVNCEDEL